MEQNIGISRDKPRELRPGAALLLTLLALVLFAGCAHRADRENLAFMRVFTPQVPEFLSGPAGALLTNTAGFSARATFESITPLAPDGGELMEGELLGRGSWLLFAPRTSQSAKKDIQLGGFSFIWDVANASGFVLSEALQGYAPVSSSLRITDVSLQPEGEPEQQSAVVTTDNGSKWLFRLSRGEDALSPPSRVSSVTNVPAFTLKLGKLRSEPPPGNLFLPPESFVKYASPEALVDELAARKNRFRRGALSEMEGLSPQTTGR